MTQPPIYSAVFRQIHNVNFLNCKSCRNVTLLTIGSAELLPGYVFGFNLNSDSAVDADVI